MEPLKESMRPIDLSEFKNMGPHTPTTIIDIPEKPENRFPTDNSFLIAFAVCVIVLMPFLIYTLAYADIRRLQGYDDCGNICGSTNPKYDEWNCTGQDFTNEKYLKIIMNDGYPIAKCVEDCGDGYRTFFGKCVSKDDPFSNINDINHEWTGLGAYLSRGSVIFRLIVCSLITVGISVGVLFLFRYVVGLVVWSIIIFVLILSIITVGMAWSDYAEERSADAIMSNGTSLTVCVLGTIFLVAYIATVYFHRERIRLVIQLLIETTNAIFAMPSLVLVPISAFVAEAIIISLCLTTTIYMATAGELTEVIWDTNRLDYVLSDGMVIIILHNLVLSLWALYFVGGLQYMAIGGAVSELYFAKDKTCLDQPVKRSTNIAFKFHLGTVAFGSLVITLAHIVRSIIYSLTKNRFMRRCVDFCLKGINDLLEFVTERAFIVTAMHGQPFVKSGKRAAMLLASNVVNVLTIRFIVKMTMVVVELLIALSSLLLSMILFVGAEEEEKDYLPMVYFIIFLMALFAGMTFVSLFETAIDTIFLCYCEDIILNDGMARPYAMSKGLMEFVENSKKVVGDNKKFAQYFDHQVSHPV